MKIYHPDADGDSSGPRLRPVTARAFRLVGLVLVAILAGAALLETLLWGKEGFGREDLPLCAGGLVVLGGAGWLWLLLCRRVQPRASVGLFGGGLVLLGFPGLLYLTFGLRTAINLARGAWLARHATITNYHDTAITWPGFDGPVALRVELDLTVPGRHAGNLLALA